MLRPVVNLVIRAAGDLLGLVAVVLLGVSGVAFLALLGVQLTSGALSPYLGILTYMVLPVGFLTGLALLVLSRWRVRRALSRGRPVPWANYVRVPAAISGLLLLVFFPVVCGKGEAAYTRVSGTTWEGYAVRWLVVSAAIFALSGALYALRQGSRR